MILARQLQNASPWFNEFGRIFDSAFGRPGQLNHPFRVYETDDGWALEGDFPARVKGDFDLEVENQSLVLKVGDEDTYRLPVGKGVNVSDIAAKHENGVLLVSLPKQIETSQTNKIEIQ